MIYRFVASFFIFMAFIAPAFSMDGETVAWEDDTLMLCVTYKPTKKDKKILSHAIDVEAVAKAGSSGHPLLIEDQSSGTQVFGSVLRSVFHLHSYQGTDLLSLQRMGPLLNGYNCRRAVVNVLKEGPLCQHLLQAGFTEVGYFDDHSGNNRSTFARDFVDDQNDNTSNMKASLEIDQESLSTFTSFYTAPSLEDEKEIGVFLRDKITKETVGGAYVQIMKGSVDRFAELVHLWIKEAKEYRGKGLGKKIMATIDGELRKVKCSSIELFTDGFYSWQFYPPLGFKIIAEIPNYSRNGQDVWNAYKMKKDLE